MKNSKLWLEKYETNGVIINKIKMLKTFNCLGLDVLELRNPSKFFLINLQNFNSNESSLIFDFKLC